mgnify:CR=1 FL=1
MLSKKDYKKLHYLIQFAFIAVFLFLGYLAVRYVFGAIAPFIIAFVAASLVEPIVRFLVSKVRLPRAAASTIGIILLLIVFFAVAAFISVFIWKEGKGLILRLPSYIAAIAEHIKHLMQNDTGIFSHLSDESIAKVMDYVANYDYSALFTGTIGGSVLGYAGNMVIQIPNVLVFCIVTIVSSFFMSISFPKVKSFILAQFKPQQQNLIIDIKKTFFSTVGKYLRSYSILMFITFAELLIFFLIFGFEPALPLAFLISIVDILPVLGVGTILIPWSLVSLLTGAPWRALILICIYIVVTIVRQVLEPKVIGDHVGMMPILTLFCIWVGLKLFGFLGMFLIPITVVILKNLQESGKINLWKTTLEEKIEKEESNNGND